MCDKKNGPGKFETEPCYAEEVYEAIVNGETVQNDEGSDVFIIDDEFRAKHNISVLYTVIYAWMNDIGFFNTHLGIE